MLKVNNVNFVTRPVFRAEKTKDKTAETNVSKNISSDGMKALAAYNIALVNPEKCVLDPPEPIMKNPDDKVDGEKIYTSDGKLYSIVQEDENTRTVFTPFEDDENKIQSIIKSDKKNGIIITKQINEYTSDREPEIYISEYSSETGKKLRSADYINGKADYISKTVYGKNSSGVDLRYYGDDKTFSISSESGNDRNKVYKNAYYDKNKQLKEVYISREFNNKQIEISAKFQNGGLYNVTKEESVTIPNDLGKEKFNDSELVPSPYFESGLDYKGIEGKKTYYSNGALEKNIFTRNGISYETIFSPEGNLIGVKMPDKEITVNTDGTQEIKEKLKNGKEKTTTYYCEQNNRKKYSGFDITIQNNNEYKQASFDENNKPKSYEEGSFNENGEKEFNISYFYNKNGALDAAFSK